MTREGQSMAWRVGEEFAARFDARSREQRADREDHAALWESLRARFPMMFDGPIAAARRFAPESPEVECERSSYGPYACAAQRSLAGGAGRHAPDAVDAPTIFAVTGLIVSRDARGEERILLGKRGGGTWLYVGMWELAPSGGVGAPEASDLGPGGEWATSAIARQLWKELAEETGMRDSGVGATPPAARPVALVHDAAVRSLDLVLRAEVEQRDASSGVVHARGEYAETAWVGAGDLTRFVRRRPGGVIEPTIAVLRLLGYLR